VYPHARVIFINGMSFGVFFYQSLGFGNRAVKGIDFGGEDACCHYGIVNTKAWVS